ncbi:MAG: hypothetical protein M3Q68_07440, partial [Actinomycetota bacterium]|nr:hypothetical protein [Actinomycetota bacterium]
MSHFLLLHGFLGQPAQWQWLESELQGRGHTTRALALPRGMWDDEIAYVHREVQAAATPPVLVGHSLGGVLVRSYAIVHPDVALGLGTIATPTPGYRAPWLDEVGRFDDDGRYHPDVARFLTLAFPGGPPELAAFPWEQPPLRGRLPEGEVSGSEPRVAILAEDDEAVPAADQQQAAALLRAP